MKGKSSKDEFKSKFKYFLLEKKINPIYLKNWLLEQRKEFLKTTPPGPKQDDYLKSWNSAAEEAWAHFGENHGGKLFADLLPGMTI